MIQCRFLWGDVDGRRKFHLVVWKELKKPIALDGLGIRLLVEMNEALQGKWLWSFMIEEDVLWRKIIAAKFGVEENGWFTCAALQSHGKSLWKRIGARKMRFQHCMRWKVGTVTK